MNPDLDPAAEDHDRQYGVEGRLPVSEESEVRKGVRVLQQAIEYFANLHGSIDVKGNTTDADDDDDDVENVPEDFEVSQATQLYLRTHATI